MLQDSKNEVQVDERKDALPPTLVYGFLGHAYRLSERGRWLVRVGDALWAVLLISSVISARLEQVSVQALLAIMAGVVVLRFVVLKVYLVIAEEPSVSMPMPERARLAMSSMPQGLVKGALRTFSVVSGASVIVISVMVVVVGRFSHKELLLMGALAMICAVAVFLDVYLGRRLRNGKCPAGKEGC